MIFNQRIRGRGAVVIVSAIGAQDRRFESSRGVRCFGLNTLQCWYSLLNLHCYCVYLKKESLMYVCMYLGTYIHEVGGIHTFFTISQT
jgi:hypothetical protein